MASCRQPPAEIQGPTCSSSLDDLQLFPPNIPNLSLPENDVAISTALPDSDHEYLTAESPTASQSPAGLPASPSSSAFGGRGPSGHIHEYSSEEKDPSAYSHYSSSERRNPSVKRHDPSSERRDPSADNHKSSSERRNSLVISHESLPEGSNRINRTPKSNVTPYLQRVSKLCNHLPHLRNVLYEGREMPCRIACYDYAGSKLLSSRSFGSSEFVELFSHKNAFLGQDIEHSSPLPIQLRLIVADDISSTLIECLGFSLDISPEMFEEHLLNSGWMDGRYDDPESDTWSTRNMTKNYTTIKWYRPVERTLKRGYSDEDRESMLNPGESLVWQRGIAPSTGKSAGGKSKGGKSKGGKSKMVTYELKALKNIFRRDWDLRTMPEATSSVNTSTTWEEKATIWIKHFETCRIVVLLIDPLPIVQSEMKEVNEVSGKHRASASRGKPKATERPVDTPDLHVIEEGRGVKEKEPYVVNRVAFKQIFPRGLTMGYENMMSPEITAKLFDHISRTKSTALSLWDHVGLNQDHQQSCDVILDPLNYLSAIIQSDTLNVLNLMDSALREIGRDMLDNSLMQQRLIHWRHLLERFDTVLDQLELSFTNFKDFLAVVNYDFENSSSLDVQMKNVNARIARLKQSTKRSYKSLMSNISILESQRGIAEAESVTKLTELAFFFIPLTFSASIFSMQVRELSTGTVSLWVFFIFAILIMISSYTLRLIIRSRSVIRRRQELFKRIRKDSGVQHGDPVSTTAFLGWCWSILCSEILLTREGFIIGIIIVGAALLSAVWTSPLVGGVKVAITFLISIIYVVILGWWVFKRFADKVFRPRIEQSEDSE